MVSYDAACFLSGEISLRAKTYASLPGSSLYQLKILISEVFSKVHWERELLAFYS